MNAATLAPEPWQPGPWQVGRAEYHADRTCDSFSTLRCFAESPELYRQKYLAGTLKEEPAEHFVVGDALHTLILEGVGTYAERFAVAPGGIDRRTKEGRSEWARFVLESQGKTLLTPEQADLVAAMRDGVSRNKAAVDLLYAPGESERAVRWIDPETRLPLKARFDRTPFVGDRIVDLKTTDSPLPAAWEQSVGRFGYHQQAALYLDGARHALGLEEMEFLHVVVGKRPPFGCVVYRLSADALRVGADDVRRMVADLHLRKFLGDWRCPHAGRIVPADLPRWMKPQQGA